ncbi:nickel-binding protein [Myxacorys almedinensis]|uniref:DUF4242 domain-containing protein n=1 Tax=Myxacorys almedinensis A TaxID=2690445 RepID=A0A8J8CLG1_9CYAN|nr:nickel-binding protein [Myxacorys almedinensis]NDJ19611.1 DUF4242 domain-containing protein [Myxacorys almedinensis A]
MSLVIVETAAEQPLTDEYLYDANQKVLPCFEARNITWHYSLLSLDRYRMICTFDAPDAESVRESYRRLGLPSRPIWAGDRIRREAAQPQQNLRDLTVRHVVEATYPPLSETDWNELSHRFLHHCAAWGIEWLQSYRSLDHTKVIYELNAPDITPIQDAQHKLEIPCALVWSAQVLINPTRL